MFSINQQFRTHQSYAERIHDNLEQKVEALTGASECENKGATNFMAFPVPDSRTPIGDESLPGTLLAGDIPGLNWQLTQAWIQLNGGAWQQIVLPADAKLTSPVTGADGAQPPTSGSAPIVLDYPFVETSGVSKQYLDFLTTAFTVPELSPYFYGAVSMQELSAAPTSPHEFAIGVNPAVTNFVLVFLRLNDNVPNGTTYMYIKDNSFVIGAPHVPNVGTAYAFDFGDITTPAGTPSDPGFYTGFSFSRATYAQDPTFTQDEGQLFVCTDPNPVMSVAKLTV